MLRRLGLALAALAVLAGVQAPSAAAEGEPETGAFNSFTLKASNGYTMTVLGFSEDNYEEGEVWVYLRRGNTAVLYRVPAAVTATKINANLGRLGRLAVEFRSSGTEGETSPVCLPKERDPYEQGVYVGEIEFRGEEGFARASAARARFSPHPFIDWFVCGRSAEDEVEEDLPGARLRASAPLPAGTGRVALRAVQNRPGARAYLQASIYERRGHIRVVRGFERIVSGGAMKFGSDLHSATLRPPAPFAGSGNFRSAASERRWTGDLSIDFPGRSDVSLTGSRFKAGLVHARWYKESPEFQRPNLLAWPSTKPSPIASATSSPLALK